MSAEAPPAPPAAIPVRPVRRRRRRTSWVVAAVLLLVAVAAGVGAYLVVTGRDEAPATPAVASALARRGTLAQTIEADFSLVQDPEVTLISPASGVITRLAVTQGTRPRSLRPLLWVNGTAVYGIASKVPFYRSLASGDEGDDVKALQSALKSAGYDPGEVDGVFGAGTAGALGDWQVAQGLEETGTMDLAQFAWFPPGAQVLSVSAKVGDRAGTQTAVASLSQPGGVVARAAVNQLDVDQLKVGQQANLTFDAIPDSPVRATVVSVAAQPEMTEQSAGTTQVIQYAVDLRLARIPSGVRAGMTGQASVVVVSRSNVVIVPTSAVGGSGANPTVQVLGDGQRQELRPVIVGLTTTDGTEILTGVQPGEQVVTGVTGSGQQGSGGDGPSPNRGGPPGFGGVVQ